MKYLALVFLAVFLFDGGCTKSIRVRFGVELFVGTNYFVSVPTTLSDAVDAGYVETARPEGPYEDLVLYCLETDKIVGLLYDVATGDVAGLQVAIPEDKFENPVYDWERLGFTYWTPAVSSTDSTLEAYWTLQQYFVSEATMKMNREERRARNSLTRDDILDEGAVWVTGFNKTLTKISSQETDIVSDATFTEQACIIFMGTHYYYKMTTDLECSADTIFPWFPLVYHGNVVGTGFMVLGSMPELSPRDWFERPAASEVQMIVPTGPNCLYDLSGSPGVLTMHIYYVDWPWTLNCIF